jgi:hypothetical protein
MISRSRWIWMPHPAHFICARDCRFHLATAIGKHIVSTVGEYLPDSTVRDIFAKSRGVELKGIGDERLADYMKKIGYEEIGFDRKYETMVFKANRSKRGCCPWEQTSGSELDFAGYNDADAAYKGHMKLCAKWARR